MSNALQTLRFEDTEITALDCDTDEPVFIASPIAKKLAYPDATHMLRGLEPDEKGLHNVETLGGKQTVNVITLPGLSHALNNRRPGAIKDEATRNMVIRFQRWVNHELVPTVMRTGRYEISQPDEESLILARANQIQSRLLGEARRENLELRASNEKMRPLALLGEAFVSADGTMSVRQAARHFQAIDKRMNCDTVYGILRGAGYIELRSKAPTVKAVKPGYLKPVMSRKANGKLDRQYARFTAKGVNWFIDRFIYGRSQGRLPGVA